MERPTFDWLDAEAEQLDAGLRDTARNRITAFGLGAASLRHVTHTAGHRAMAYVEVDGKQVELDITDAIIGCLEKLQDIAYNELCEYGGGKEADQARFMITAYNRKLNAEWEDLSG